MGSDLGSHVSPRLVETKVLLESRTGVRSGSSSECGVVVES